MRDPLTALIWKEWRQQRAVVAAGVALAAMLPALAFAVALPAGNPLYLIDFAELVPFLMAIFVWPLFAAIVGATTNADEKTDASLCFLLSRPVTRARVWGAKVITAAFALGLVVTASFAIAQLVYFSYLDRWFRFPFPSDTVATSTLPTAATQVLAIGMLFLPFAAAIFLSLFVRQAIAVAAGGVVVAGLLVTVGLSLQSVLSASPGSGDGGETFLFGYMVSLSAALLAGSYYVFSTGDGLTRVDVRRPLGVAVAGMLVASLLGTTVSAAIATGSDPDTATVADVQAIPGSREALIGTRNSYFGGTTYWIGGPGRPLRDITGRMASSSVVSPTGEWIVYSSRLGPLGFRARYCGLWAVRPDGNDRHRIAESVDCRGAPVFSPDGTRVAIYSRRRPLLVYTVESDSPLGSIRIIRPVASGMQILGWLDDSRLLLRNPRVISAIDAETGAVDVLFEDEKLYQVFVRAASRTRLVVRLEDREELVDGASLDAETTAALAERPGQVRLMRGRSGDWIARYDLLLLDLQAGSTSALLEACAETSTSAFSGDGNLLFYTACGGDAALPDELWVRDFGNKTDTRIDIRVGDRQGRGEPPARIEGRFATLVPSPSAASVLLTAIGPQPRPSRRYFVIDRDGSATELEALYDDGIWRRGEPQRRWRFRDWLDEDTLLVLREAAWGGQAGYLNIATGDVEILAGSLVEGS